MHVPRPASPKLIEMSSGPRSKASLSGLEFRVLSKEMLSALEGTYVSNVYSVGESQLLRMRRAGGDEVSVVLSPRLGAWITERPARVETTEFTTALRSSLLRARLASVSQADLDRVLTLGFEGRGGEGPTALVLEMMPPGNLVLTGGDGKVVVALREVRAEGRRVSKGRPYAPPPQTRASLETLTRADLEAALAKEKTLGRALGRGLSIPRRYVDEILDRVGMAQGSSADVTPAQVDALMKAAKELVEELDAPWPCLVRTEGGTVEPFAVKPTRLEVVKSAPSLSPLLDELLLPELLAGEEGRKEASEGEGEARERRLAEYRATIAGLESKKASLAARSADLRELAAKVRGAGDAAEAAEIAMSVPSLEGLEGKGQAATASAIFDRAKKAEREIGDIEEAIEGVEAKLRKEGEKATAARPRTTALSRVKREWYEKFRWFFTTGGKLAIGGRDAQSNTTLVRRHLDSGDTVYHADLFGSPFFVLKGGRDQTEQEVREVAKATVTFSSAWKTGLGAADAYWVTPDQVAAAGPSGEYLAHGSFAIKGKKNFVTKNPVEVAVGVDGSGRVVSGPEEAIMAVAKAHVELVPSRDKPSDTAKKVLHELLPYAGQEAGIGVDDVLRMLPAGGGKIVRRRADRPEA